MSSKQETLSLQVSPDAAIEEVEGKRMYGVLIGRINAKLADESVQGPKTDIALANLKIVLHIGKSINCRTSLIGSQANTLDEPDWRRESDFDTQEEPLAEDTPFSLAQKLKTTLEGFKVHSRDINTGKMAYIPDPSHPRIVLLTRPPKPERGRLSSMKLVYIQQLKSDPFGKNTIFDIGFPLYDSESGWLTAGEYDPTQKKVWKISEGVVRPIEVHQRGVESLESINSPQARTVIVLRCLAAGIRFDKMPDLPSFYELTTGNEDFFRDNLLPALQKASRNLGKDIILDEKIREELLPKVWPYIYQQIKTFNLDSLIRFVKQMNINQVRSDPQILGVMAYAVEQAMLGENRIGIAGVNARTVASNMPFNALRFSENEEAARSLMGEA